VVSFALFPCICEIFQAKRKNFSKYKDTPSHGNNKKDYRKRHKAIDKYINMTNKVKQ